MPLLTEIWQRAAHRLGGEPVPVYMTALDRLDGVAARASDGRLYIAVAVGLRGLKLLYVFLHEVAHVKRGDVPLGRGYPTLGAQARASWASRVAAGDVEPAREDPAKRMALDWMIAACQRAGESASIEELLEALL